MTFNANTLDEYFIDPKLVRAWVDLPVNRPIEVELYKAHLDFLYLSIEASALATARLREMIAFAGNGMPVEAVDAEIQSRVMTMRSINSLRHFQTLVMAGVTGLQIDDDGKVVADAPD